MLLGLKASTDQRQIRDRLQYHPDVFEFHLTENDFTEAGWSHFCTDGSISSESGANGGFSSSDAVSWPAQ